MIEYTLDAAKGAMEEGDELCVSTDDAEIIQFVEDYGVKVPFVRPEKLASDTAGSDEVIRHAVRWYKNQGITFDVVVFLQATSPLRNTKHIKEALELWSGDIDMVVSVKETDSNPYYVLFEEDIEGFLKKSKQGEFNRRQDCPKVYEYNGAIYIFQAGKELSKLKRNKKYLMDECSSIDVDTKTDIIVAEYFLNQ